ncbi:MAG: BolA/IbaG family iron-sulfur metabolism protein [Magnetococcales bacterium]|nr:BolA/IbaG family iron-sulfur metabolism protein [Magnetococcales bacterium]
METEKLRKILEQGLEHEYMALDGDGRHFDLTVVSGAFRGLGKVQQHQLVYKVLGDLMIEDVHALVMKTYTPELWAEQNK